MTNIGTGFISFYGFSHLGQFGKPFGLPAISISAEQGYKPLGPGILGIGGSLGFKEGGFHYDPSHYSNIAYNENWSAITLAPRVTYHPDKFNTEKYEVYGSLQLGLRYFTYKNSYYESISQTARYNSLSPFFSLIAGGRYYLNSNIAVFAEVGYDIAFMKLGVALKLK